jgi:hypothetical protein
MPLTEEIGETFEDWHWNRHDHTALLSLESQASLIRLDPTTMVNEVWPLIERQQGRWGDIAGSIYHRRNDLVHGNEWEVPDLQLQQIELLARVF